MSTTFQVTFCNPARPAASPDRRAAMARAPSARVPPDCPRRRRSNEDPEDFVQLFFEPTSEASRDAAQRSAQRLAARVEGRSPDVPYEWAGQQLGEGPRNAMFPADAVLHVLKKTSVSVLHLGADHDIIFPVENWYALNAQLPTLQLVTFPSAGHGPQLQYPQGAARHIGAFLAGNQGMRG